MIGVLALLGIFVSLAINVCDKRTLAASDIALPPSQNLTKGTARLLPGCSLCFLSQNCAMRSFYTC